MTMSPLMLSSYTTRHESCDDMLPGVCHVRASNDSDRALPALSWRQKPSFPGALGDVFGSSRFS
jgi:hypothetical protein